PGIVISGSPPSSAASAAGGAAAGGGGWRRRGHAAASQRAATLSVKKIVRSQGRASARRGGFGMGGPPAGLGAEHHGSGQEQMLSLGRDSHLASDVPWPCPAAKQE